MEHLLRLLALLAAISWTLAIRTDMRESETELLRLLLNPERYDKRVRPPTPNETGSGSNDFVLVRVNTLIPYLGPIDDHNKDFTVSLVLRQTWNDRRLQFSPHDDLKYIVLTRIEDIWSPDLFFSNEKEGHVNELLKPNTLVRIMPNGDVLYSTRLNLKLSCPMDLTNFPLDRQVCFIRMASYAYTVDALVFLWHSGESVQLPRNLSIKPFEMEYFRTDYCNSKTVTGIYSCIRIEFILKRLAYGYILRLFLPLGLLVAASWAPLWLDFHGEERSPLLAIVGRCLLALICLITTITEAARVSTSAPPCSGYSCAIDVWTTFCQIFVALVFLEVIIVAVIDHWWNNHHCTSGATKAACLPMNHDGVEADEPKLRMYNLKKWFKERPTVGQRIDIFCRILFPLAFIIFNLAYWSTYAGNTNEG